MAMDDTFSVTTETQLIVGGFLIILLVGIGLIWLLFGQLIAVVAGGIVVGGGSILAVLWLAFHLLGLWAGNR